MRRIRLLVLIMPVAALLTGSCNWKGSGTKENYDSLFLGISLGMQKKAFFDYCWEMNKQKMFIHGPSNQSVQYTLKDVLEQPIMMQFYPSFHEDKIYEMPVTFSYEAWAPWNKQYSADTLFLKMLPVLQGWYGSFKILEHPQMGKVYYRIDGKRRVNYFIRDDQFVQVVFTDLKVEKELTAARGQNPDK